MASHQASFAEVLSPRSWECLLLLLRDADPGVFEYALWALGNISMQPEGAKAAVSVGILIRFPEILESSHKELRSSACRLLGIIAQHEPTSVPVLATNPCSHLVLLLRDSDTIVIQNSLFALWNISEWPDGAQAALDVEILNLIPELLDSPDVDIRRPASYLLDKIARHNSPILNTFPVHRLLSLLRCVWRPTNIE
ncbi:armadillo-type protein [Roridomyces roridus]|uniref:Armadillo-type protein n=1 Tax=Roridomyces roridus TaxID=1738132 RepID=A0AAD7C0V6_9AGAR|nr:armadillo-type protein [Roridomyces roridus]